MKNSIHELAIGISVRKTSHSFTQYFFVSSRTQFLKHPNCVEPWVSLQKISSKKMELKKGSSRLRSIISKKIPGNTFIYIN